MIDLILCVGKNNVVGKDGDLCFKIKEDLQRFKTITQGKSILMGRKTLESLNRLLPSRHHIILTTNENYDIPENYKKGINENTTYEIINSLENIVRYNQYNSESEIICIGGANLANKLIGRFNKLYLTLVNEEAEGDSYIDDWDLSDFKITHESDYMKSDEKLEYKYIVLEKV